MDARFHALLAAFARTQEPEPADLVLALRGLPGSSKLPSPWETWTLIGLAVVVGGFWFYERSQSIKSQRAETAYFQARQAVEAGNLPLGVSDLQKVVTRYGGTAAGSQATLPVLLGGLGLAGAGIGLSGAGLQTSALEAVGPEEAGMAAGVYSTSRYFGSIVGASVLAGLLTSADSFDLVFTLVSVAAVLAVVLSLGLPGRRHLVVH